MNLREYFFSLPNAEARAEFARRAGTTKMYVHQLMCMRPKTRRKPSPRLAKALHEASYGQIPLSKLRADIWAD